MALAVYNPFRVLESSFSRDPFFRELFREGSRTNGEVSLVLAPRMNVTERAESYELTLEVPGLAKEDLNIEVNDGRLAVWGEKKAERQENDKKIHVREIVHGAFRRELTLPEDVRQDGIQAAYENGHLKLTLPREDKKKSARRVALS